MSEKYDIIVLGSGLGGLVCANILSKEGLKVLVLEKNNQFGGNLQTFVRERRIFDTGVHYIAGLDKGQNLYNYFSYLGIMDDLKIIRMNEKGFDYVIFGDDENEYPYAQGEENFVKELGRFFPDEKENIREYYYQMKNLCENFPMYNLSPDQTEEIEDKFSNPASEVINKITSNPKLQAVLAGTNYLYAGEKGKTPFYVHSLSVFSYIESAWRCIRGGSQISKLLVKEIRKHGGTVLKHQEVCELDVIENEVRSVKTTSGEVYYGEKFISNIDPKITLNLLKGANIRKNYINRIRSAEDTISCFSLYIVLKPNTFNYHNHNYYYFKKSDNVWNGTKYTEENWPIGYMVSMTPKEENTDFADCLTVLTYMRIEDTEAWKETSNTVNNKNNRGETYEEFKRRKSERLIDELEKKFPDIRNSIKSYYSSTPLTYRDYIGSETGSMYGFAKDAAHPLKAYLPVKTKINNMFLTGQSIGMHGILGVTISAVLTCSELIGKEYLMEKINRFPDGKDPE